MKVKLMRSARSGAVLVAGLLAVTLTSCGPSAQAGKPLGGDSGWEERLLAEAPVANSSKIPAGVLRQIHDRGVLVYGGSKTQKLFSQFNPFNGEMEGFDATLAKLLAKYLTGKPNVQQKIVTSETRESLLNNGTIDAVLYTYSITPERQKQVDFVGPYFISGQSVAVSDSSKDIKSLADLAHKNVCVTKGGTAYLTMRDKVPSANLITLESSTECEQMLRQHRVDAEVQDRAILLGQAAKGGVKVLPQTLTYEPYGIGIPHDNKRATAFLNDWLKQLIKTKEWKRLYDHTVGTVPGAKVQVPTPGKDQTPNLSGAESEGK